MISYVKRNITNISKKGDFIASIYAKEDVDIFLETPTGKISVKKVNGNVVFDEPIPTFVNMTFSRPVHGVFLLYDTPVSFPSFFMLFDRKWKYEKKGCVSEIIFSKL